MNLKIYWVIAATSILLSACNGQDPLKRESNPLKEYPAVAESVEKREGLIPYDSKPPVVPDADNSQLICSQAFYVTTNSSFGNHVFAFSEDASTTYEIEILNRLGDGFKATPKNLPAGMTLIEIPSLKSNNTKLFHLSWNPKKVLKGKTLSHSQISIQFQSESLISKCANAMAKEQFEVLVLKSDEKPILSLNGLPQTAIAFGDQFQFQIEVSDVTASDSQRPKLNAFTLGKMYQNNERKVLDASDAVVNCSSQPENKNDKWVFTCTFMSSGIKGVEKVLNSGKTLEAGFVASATGSNGQISNQTKGSVRVQFKPAATATTQVQEDGGAL